MQHAVVQFCLHYIKNSLESWKAWELDNQFVKRAPPARIASNEQLCDRLRTTMSYNNNNTGCALRLRFNNTLWYTIHRCTLGKINVTAVVETFKFYNTHCIDPGPQAQRDTTSNLPNAYTIGSPLLRDAESATQITLLSTWVWHPAVFDGLTLQTISCIL